MSALSRAAVDMAALPLRNPESGKATIFLNLACLVERAKTPALLSGLRKLAVSQKRKGVVLTWSGPWPAYSFAGGLFSSRASGKT